MGGPVLREVVTRFRLETDEKGAQHLEKRVEGIKHGLKDLASVFGITLGVAGALAVGKMGYEAERAKVNLEYLAGTDFGPLMHQIEIVQRRMENARAGSSKIFREEDIHRAAAAWTTAFGGDNGLTGNVEKFGTVLKFAETQAAITGKKVDEIVAAIQGAIQNGGMEALMEVPGFNQFQRQTLEWIDKVTDPKEPGGRTGIELRAQRIIEILQQQDAAQNKALKKVPAELLAIDSAGAQMKETMAKLGQTLDKLLVEVIPRLIPILEWMTDKLGIVNKAIDQKGVAGAVKSGASGFVDRVSEYDSMLRSGAVGGTADIAAQRAKREAELDKRKPFSEMTWGEVGRSILWDVQPLRRGDGVNRPATSQDDIGMRAPSRFEVREMNNTFHIQSNDPAAVAREVEKKLNDSVRDARSSAVPTEER